MNIENLCRVALKVIKDTWGIPKTGFIAGGSIANIVWQLVSGKKAIVNDIDVFIFRNKIDKFSNVDRDSLYRYKVDDIKAYEDYTGINWSTYTKNFYSIASSEKDGIFNVIEYDSNVEDPRFIIDSFDINCTAVGYSIDEDKFYWTKEFENFLKTGELKIVNLTTPSHTAIRIIKKSDELGCKLDESELKILSYVIDNSYYFSDISKRMFKERYYEIFEKYSDKLNNYFNVVRCLDDEMYIKSRFNSDDKLYKLTPVKYVKEEKVFDVINMVDRGFEYWGDSDITSIQTCKNFLFYIRNIYGNEEIKKIWNSYNFNTEDYIDCQPSGEDLALLKRLVENTRAINSLNGYTLSEQLNIIKTLFNEFSDDPIIAISLLEKEGFKMPDMIDDSEKLLLELSVRREIVNDTKGKVRKVLNLEDKI
jgi:hypothetical protein